MEVTQEIIDKTTAEMEYFRKYGIIAEQSEEEAKEETEFMDLTFSDPDDFQTKIESKSEIVSYLESVGFVRKDENL